MSTTFVHPDEYGRVDCPDYILSAGGLAAVLIALPLWAALVLTRRR